MPANSNVIIVNNDRGSSLKMAHLTVGGAPVPAPHADTDLRGGHHGAQRGLQQLPQRHRVLDLLLELHLETVPGRRHQKVHQEPVQRYV